MEEKGLGSPLMRVLVERDDAAARSAERLSTSIGLLFFFSLSYSVQFRLRRV